MSQIPNSHGVLLNLIFSSSNEPSVSCAPTPIFRPDAYHPPLLIHLPLHYKPHNRISRAYRDFKSGNYVSMSQYLSSFNWPLTFSEYSINDAAVVFNDALLKAIGKFIPLKTFFLLFADHIKIYLKIDSPENCLILQFKLDTFTKRVSRLGLFLNLGKCHIMSFNRSRSPILHPYRLCDVLINRVFVFKYLGIFYISSLSFEHHINIIVPKALKILGLIKRVSKTFSSANCLRSLYFCLVRFILDLAPLPSQVSTKTRSVQNIFLLQIVHPAHDYSLVRQTLNIQTLSNRCLPANIIFVSSLLNGSLDDPTLLFSIPSYPTRNHTPLYIPSLSSNYDLNHPMHRMFRNYNNAFHYYLYPFILI
ncbi:Uncharacterized protein FWK35_00013939 [Aphis craccivora]|uniref:Reverse transcriptase domain-containing protein n=1 Tax=Aphis craccivora TaxID=307492 RepID=A0A6G0Y3Q2_APHCR|nr:Uncharacterized protein FWK35_00013939 [Aphis craccivora]